MTLTAINPSLQTFFPAADIAKGQSESEVLATYTTIQSSSGLFCPHCYEKMQVLSPVKYRRGSSDRRPHFYHKQDEETQSRCVNYNQESEHHIIAKNTIAAQLKCLPSVASVEIDKIWLKAEYESGETRKRKPDILATFVNGSKVAHEIQIARITPEEIMERTQDMLAASVSVVVWYLFGGNFKDSQIRWALWNNGIQHYHLWFSDDSPVLRLVDEPPESKPRKRKGAQDDCYRDLPAKRVPRADMFEELSALEDAIARKEEADRDREARRLEVEAARAKAIADQALRERIAEIDLQDFEPMEPEQRSLSSLQPAVVARSPLTTQRRNLPTQYVGMKVRCRHKPGWTGFVYEQPWGLEGICLDIQWVESAIDPGTEKPYPLPHNPQRFDVKDLELSEG